MPGAAHDGPSRCSQSISFVNELDSMSYNRSIDVLYFAALNEKKVRRVVPSAVTRWTTGRVDSAKPDKDQIELLTYHLFRAEDNVHLFTRQPLLDL